MANAEELCDGGRTVTATATAGGASPASERRSWRERLGALRNLPPILKLVWRTSPVLTLSQSLLRVVRAVLPVATLYVGKLIIDEVVLLVQAPRAEAARARLRPADGRKRGDGQGSEGLRPARLAGRRARFREYDRFALRANIGVLFQDSVRYHFTVADNIAVGRIEARGDRARIVAAGGRSLADEVIRKLPWRYDQIIGKRFRTGIDLTAGGESMA
jgi:hypothetical protein